MNVLDFLLIVLVITNVMYGILISYLLHRDSQIRKKFDSQYHHDMRLLYLLEKWEIQIIKMEEIKHE